MALINMLVQLVGCCVGIYLMFARGFGIGVGLIALILIGHFLFRQLSDALMLIHQKRMSQDELHNFTFRARFGGSFNEAPAAWKAIAYVCGSAYFILAVGAIWLFLSL